MKDTHVDDPQSDSDTGDNAREVPGGDSPPAAPRWVKVFGVVFVVLVLLVVILHLTGNGLGGHSMHRP